GAAARTVRNQRAAPTRQTASARPTPIAIAPTISVAVPPRPARFSAWTPKTAPRAARKIRCRTKAAWPLTSSTSTSTASRTRAGTKTTTSPNRRMSPGVEPCAAKNSAFLPRMSKSGCAKAKPETANSWAKRRAGSRRRARHPALLPGRVHLLGDRALAGRERPAADPRALGALPGDARAAARGAVLALARSGRGLPADPGGERALHVARGGAVLPARPPAR